MSRVVQVLVGLVILLLLDAAYAQKTKISDQDNICSKARFKDEAVRDLCNQVQAQSSELARLRAEWYGHVRAEEKALRSRSQE
jgi:hypothetical protein